MINKGQKWYVPNRSRKYKKRWQEYTELYKKDLHDPDNQIITQIITQIIMNQIIFMTQMI